MNKNKFKNALKESEKIILYKNIKNDNLILKLKKYLNNHSSAAPNLSEIIYDLTKISIEQVVAGDLWHNYLKKLLTDSENIFTLKAEKKLINKNSSLYQIALHDIKIIKNLFNFSFKNIIENANGLNYSYLENFKLSNPESDNYNQEIYQQLFTSNSPKDCLKELINFYSNYGAGILNKSRAFYWEKNTLKIVNNPDPISFNDLISYQKEKDKLIENTENFLNDFYAHNVLLYGDSGTGKSSSVKAILNKYYKTGLRLIEINSSQIKNLAEILEYLNKRGLYFIIFMDDLSFEEFETDYKYLKAVMEGGIESRPANTLFYATSNRRHLVREKWQDRESEVHENDILNEKLSLAERFGLTLMYNNPSRKEYLKIVRKLALKSDLNIKTEVLEEKALEWSQWNNGFSGRSAKQFINQLPKKEYIK